MKKPKVSVIVPFYNSEKFLDRSVGSVINQTYSNWELICIDDLSTDKTAEILKKYAQENPKIKFFEKETRGGYAAPNMNYALKHVTGDFVLGLGHDDEISPDCLEKLIKRQIETGADIVVPDCCYTYTDDKSKNWTMAGIVDCWGKTNKSIDRSIILTNRKAFELSLFWQIHAFILIRTSIVQKYKYCEEGMNGDEYSLRLFYLNANKIAFCDGIYYYWQMSSSITKKLSPKLWDIYKTLYLLEKLLIENHFEYVHIRNVQEKREHLYKVLLKKYNRSKNELSKEEQKQIEWLLNDNYQLLKKINILKYKTFKDYMADLFSISNVGNKKVLRILGIKIRYK